MTNTSEDHANCEYHIQRIACLIYPTNNTPGRPPVSNCQSWNEGEYSHMNDITRLDGLCNARGVDMVCDDVHYMQTVVLSAAVRVKFFTDDSSPHMSFHATGV